MCETQGLARAAGKEAKQPWNNSDEMEVRHSAWARPAEFAAAAEAAAMVATATNRTADDLGLPNGALPPTCTDSCEVLASTLLSAEHGPRPTRLSWRPGHVRQVPWRAAVQAARCLRGPAVCVSVASDVRHDHIPGHMQELQRVPT